jgi:hypothetical protein
VQTDSLVSSSYFSEYSVTDNSSTFASENPITPLLIDFTTTRLIANYFDWIEVA